MPEMVDTVEANQMLGSFPKSGKWSLKGIYISFSGKKGISEKSSIPASKDGEKGETASAVSPEGRSRSSGIQGCNVVDWDCNWWSWLETVAFDSSSKTSPARDKKCWKIVRTWIIGRLVVSMRVRQSVIVVMSLKSSVPNVAMTLQNSTKYAVMG